ncbi:hypothetical protein GCM10017786_52090 [Amycolatopsis deserti]|uniref:Uncharacterized protein n=1 Tax=Amycolatopsis deserti TaxID=185696 RepID=A0ABQ3J933_9PSEU|nr:hypothetical protein GCM10017786_52090 [Amycolatopsis deserti]
MNAPIANTTVWTASNGHHPVIRTTASTTVVMTAAKRGPRGSTAGPADMSPPWRGARERASELDFSGGGSAGTAEADPLEQTQAAAHAAEVDRATLRQQS